VIRCLVTWWSIQREAVPTSWHIPNIPYTTPSCRPEHDPPAPLGWSGGDVTAVRTSNSMVVALKRAMALVAMALVLLYARALRPSFSFVSVTTWPTAAQYQGTAVLQR
jgi:hypothetical protein